ncbi:CDP-glycerol glycerophosphotransferase family protein [Leifsonia bigeumensis]|uniref:CDP-glycerol glycerophosphotransferase family protein n=1 Tax=Leifsonella bigeumensis TaxID=433643 RepID=A0ABP7FWD0_9MICO
MQGELEHPARGSVRIVLYFADPKVNLYQLRQWYQPLVELSKTWPVVVVSRSPSSMLRLIEESPLPVVYLRKIVDFENFLAEQDIRIVLYVNQNVKNFQSMRYGRMWHVFINHGESDKAYMASNQYKAYDYAMVAGDAALERLSHALWDYDVSKRALVIGRPQADYFTGELPYTPDDRVTVLYAPTWEGDRGSMSYGSVLTHGLAIARSLLADSRFRLIYRPHPRSGVTNPEYRQANEQIIGMIAAANARDSRAQHVFDENPAIGWQLGSTDVAITDISAMVYDRLATGKPLIVTRPSSPEAQVETDGYLGSAEWLDADAAPDVIAQVERVRGDAEALERLQHWVKYHFGDTTPGAATGRFHGAVQHLMGEWEQHAAIHLADKRVGQFDVLDGDEDDEDEAPGAD